MANYVGIAALTMVRQTNGAYQYVYVGQPVNGDVPDEELERLLDEGFIAELPDEVVEAVATVDVPPVGGPQRPAQAASKELWVAYAVATGSFTEDEAEKASKADLIAALS